MPIEALIDPDNGNVIVVKPWGSVWGRCEVNAVMLLDDPALEKELIGSGGDHVIYPYAAWEEIEQSLGDQVVRRRELREASLVKVTVNDAAAMKTISSKPGILRAKDADYPVVVAQIADVVAVSSGGKESRETIAPDRPLPEKT